MNPSAVSLTSLAMPVVLPEAPRAVTALAEGKQWNSRDSTQSVRTGLHNNMSLGRGQSVAYAQEADRPHSDNRRYGTIGRLRW